MLYSLRVGRAGGPSKCALAALEARAPRGVRVRAPPSPTFWWAARLGDGEWVAVTHRRRSRPEEASRGTALAVLTRTPPAAPRKRGSARRQRGQYSNLDGSHSARHSQQSENLVSPANSMGISFRIFFSQTLSFKTVSKYLAFREKHNELLVHILSTE